MINQLNCAAASGGSSTLEQAAAARRSNAVGQRRDRASRALLVERAAELGEAAGLADHEPAQLHHPRLHHQRELAPGEVAQVGVEVAAVLRGRRTSSWTGSLASSTVAMTISANRRSLSAKCL